MTDEQRELDKLRLLMNAVNSLREDEPDFYADLKDAAAAWNVLHDNPGTECGDWINLLIEQYPTEVVDALGNNPLEVFAELEDMWETMDYEDEETGECHTFSQWSEFFATDRSVELYDMLVDAKREIKAHRATQTSKLTKTSGEAMKSPETQKNGLFDDISWLQEKIILLEQRIKDKDEIISILKNQ